MSACVEQFPFPLLLFETGSSMEAKQRELQAAVNDMMSKVWHVACLAFIDRQLTVALKLSLTIVVFYALHYSLTD